MLNLEEKLLKIKNGKIVNPFQVELHLTNVCNHNCKWCINHEIRENKLVTIPYEKVVTILESLKSIGCESILFSGGGEPLAHKDAEKILCYAHSLGIDVSLITNGGLLNKLDLKKLVDSVSLIRISVDSYDDLTYQLIHRPKYEIDTFASLCNSIERIVQIKNNKSKLFLSYILDEKSITGLIKFYEMSFKLGVDGIDIKTNHYQDYTKRKEYIHKAKEILGKINSDNLIINYDPVKRRSNFVDEYWYGLCYSCVIEADGNIYPCCHKVEDSFIIGNIYDNDFGEIWYGNKHKELVNKYYNNKMSCPVCADSSLSNTVKNIINKLFD